MSDYDSTERSPEGTVNTASVARMPELEDWLNRQIFHPLARRLAVRLVPTGITPNWISIAGGACVVLAGIAYTCLDWPLAAIIGFALHLAWHVLDGADGDLARLTGKANPLGEVVDGLSDYLSHFALYGILAIMLYPAHGMIAWLMVIGAGFCRIFQTSHYEERRREYQWWVYGRSWIRNKPLVPVTRTERVLGRIVMFYLSVASKTEGSSDRIEQLLNVVAQDPARLDAFRQRVQENLCPLLRPLGLLGSNHRTVALGFAMLLQRPMWYLLYEFVLLNGVLVWSIKEHSAAARQIAPTVPVAAG